MDQLLGMSGITSLTGGASLGQPSLTSIPGFGTATSRATTDLTAASSGPDAFASQAMALVAQQQMVVMLQTLVALMANMKASGTGTGATGSTGGTGTAGSSGGTGTAATGSTATTGDNSPAGAINNTTDFAHALLKRLGAPDTPANVASLAKWAAREGGHWHNTAHFNPLCTTQNEPGATSMNSVGVKAYKSWDQGLDAAVATLNNGRYGDLVAALKSGKGLSSGSYKGLSTWSGGAYSSI